MPIVKLAILAFVVICALIAIQVGVAWTERDEVSNTKITYYTIDGR